MPSPFPGMDPFLEDPNHWGNVHHGIISEIRAALNAQMRPKYYARVEERVYVMPFDDPAQKLFRVPDVQIVRERRGHRRRNGHQVNGGALATLPVELTTIAGDDEVHEYSLKVIDAASRSAVAIIEVLSPSNKVSGSTSRREYLTKRQEILNSPTHWVEIDLLRAGAPIGDRWGLNGDYLVHVSRADRRPKGLVWPIGLREPLPVIRIPLKDADESTPLDLQSALATAYDRGACDASIDYRRPPNPPLKPADAAWANKLLRKAGIRSAKRSR